MWVALARKLRFKDTWLILQEISNLINEFEILNFRFKNCPNDEFFG